MLRESGAVARNQALRVAQEMFKEHMIKQKLGGRNGESGNLFAVSVFYGRGQKRNNVQGHKCGACAEICEH